MFVRGVGDRGEPIRVIVGVGCCLAILVSDGKRVMVKSGLVMA
jgi:hypothetical protein